MPVENYYSNIKKEIFNYFVIQSKKPFWQEMLKGTLSNEIYTYWVKVDYEIGRASCRERV